MKRLKKILALAIAMAMVLGMTSMAAFADDVPTSGSITITDSTGGTVEAQGRTFTAYRILDATEVFPNPYTEGGAATGYAYTIPSAAIRSALVTKFNVTAKGENETDAAYDQRIIEAVRAAAEADVQQTAKDLLKIAKDNSAVSYSIQGGTAKTDLPFGYYVIEDNTTPTTETGPVSAVMLDTNNPNVTINVKAEKPSIDKNIDGATDTDPDTTGKSKTNKVNIGDDVPFVIDTKVPSMLGYSKYYFIVHDTLSKGLDFKNDVAIKLGGETLPASAYEVTTSDTPEGGTDIKIVFKNFIQYKGELVTAANYQTLNGKYNLTGTADELTADSAGTYAGSKEGQNIVITYSATVNKDAEVGKIPNKNEVTLEYSNKPTANPQGENEPGDGDGDVTGTTPSSETKTYTTGLMVLKVSDASDETKVLEGAKFELKGVLNKVEVTTEEKFVEDAAGTYWKLASGAYTDIDPATFANDANLSAEKKAEIAAKYANDGKKYKKTTVEKAATGTAGSKVVEATTDEAGYIKFDGMTKGSYTLTEKEAPTGYNMLKEPITFDVTWTAPAASSDDCTWAVTNVVPNTYQIDVQNDGTLKIKVLNQTGTELPSTGGIGTTIFYVVGAILVIGAGVVLVTRRRMDA